MMSYLVSRTPGPAATPGCTTMAQQQFQRLGRLLALLLASSGHADVTPLDSGVSYWHGSILGSNDGAAGYTMYR